MSASSKLPDLSPTPAVGSTSSPISVLSAELLTLILDYTLTSAYRSDAFACGPDDDSVLLAARLTGSLSSVCALWRAVITGNPLWHDTISIVPPMWNQDLEKGLQRVRAQLERSAQVPLDIRIFGHADYTSTSTAKSQTVWHNNSSSNSHDTEKDANDTPSWKEYKPLFELLTPHLPRCRSLQIRGVFSKEMGSLSIPFPPISRLFEMDMPLLEKFILEAEMSHYDDFMFPSLRVQPMSMFRSAPRLQQLRMVGVGISRFSLPPVQLLTSLHLSRSSSSSSHDFTTFTSLAAVLTSCPTLHTLAVYDEVLRAFTGPQTFFSCPAPSLEIVMILGNMLSVSELLLFLDAPKLKEVVIAPVVPSDLSLLMSVIRPQYQSDNSSRTASTQNSTSRALRSRFQNLTTLTLAPAHPEAFDAVSLASKCFPFVEHLILANIYLIPFKLLFVGGLCADVLDGGLGDYRDGGGNTSEEYAEWDRECERDSDDEEMSNRGATHSANYLGTNGGDNTHNNDDSDSDTNSNLDSNVGEGDRRRITLFPNMLTLSLTDVDTRFAWAIRDMQVLRGFRFEDAARAFSLGDGHKYDYTQKKRKKWRSKHSAARNRLLSLTRGAGGKCVPLRAVYLDSESYNEVRNFAHVWNEFSQDYEWLESDVELQAEKEKGKELRGDIKDYDKYIRKADAWEARRRMALFAQAKDLYVGQPQDHDEY